MSLLVDVLIMAQSRLDLRLVQAGLVATRSRARDLILRGFVSVDGVACDKPSQTLADDARIALSTNAPQYVSRGAEKLVAALDQFGFEARGAAALDIGASTGGFTEVLLSRGARWVYAVDVGQRQLHEKLRRDVRVISLEQQDARTLSRDLVPDPITAVVADVSFISLTKVLAPAMALTAPGAWLVALIKPQFEVGPDAVASGGIVRDEAARDAAVDAVRQWIAGVDGWRVVGLIPSPILGGSGNTEYLIGARRDG